MGIYSTIVKFFQDSGVFIYPSILILSLGLAIAIERFIYINRSRRHNREMWEALLPLLKTGKFQQVMQMTAKSDTAIGKIVSYGLSRIKGAHRREDIDAAMELGYGHPMGPLRVSDVVGLDVRLKIADYLHQELGEQLSA